MSVAKSHPTGQMVCSLKWASNEAWKPCLVSVVSLLSQFLFLFPTSMFLNLTAFPSPFPPHQNIQHLKFLYAGHCVLWEMNSKHD